MNCSRAVHVNGSLWHELFINHSSKWCSWINHELSWAIYCSRTFLEQFMSSFVNCSWNIHQYSSWIVHDISKKVHELFISISQGIKACRHNLPIAAHSLAAKTPTFTFRLPIYILGWLWYFVKIRPCGPYLLFLLYHNWITLCIFRVLSINYQENWEDI